jgi:hypothetical protein
VRLPHRAAVERLERLAARLHVEEASEPDEPVRAIEVPELPEQLHADRLLRFDQGPVEELDQHLPLARVQRVLAKLDHWAALRHDDLLARFRIGT